MGALALPANAAPSSDLGAIKQCESGGDYGAVNPSSGASGAYQFLTSTWQSMGATTAGYANAADAPAAVQDKAAQELMARSGASQWECSGMIASGSYTPPASTPSVAPQSTHTAPVAEAPAAPAAPAAAPVAEAPAAPAAPVVEAPAAQAPVAQAPVAQAPVAQAPVLPAASEAPATVEYTAPVQAPTAPVASGSSYTVQPGDTLSSIAAKFGVDGGFTALQAANADSVVNVNLIFPGQVLNIPA